MRANHLNAETLSVLARLPRIPGKTVYLLGIGFSRALGSPTITEFLPQGMAMLKEHVWDNRSPDDVNLIQQMTDLMGRYLPLLRTSNNLGDPTIEDLFSIVDLLDNLDSHVNGADKSDPPRSVLQRFVARVCTLALDKHIKAYSQIKEGSASTSWPVPLVDLLHLNKSELRDEKNGGDFPFTIKEREAACVYAAVLSQIVAANQKAKSRMKDFECFPEDAKKIFAKGKTGTKSFLYSSIISLNYDMVVEKKFTAVGYSESQSPAVPNSAAPIFTNCKLFYGNGVSFNEKEKKKKIPWLAKPTDSLRKKEVVLPLIKLHGSLNWQSKDFKSIQLEADSPPGKKAKGSLAPLVLPTWVRGRFEDAFAQLLGDARIHLRLASRIVIVGYSLPQMDKHLRYLLADALSWQELPEICIYDVRSKEEMIKAWEGMTGNLGKCAKVAVKTGGLIDLALEWKPSGLC